MAADLLGLFEAHGLTPKKKTGGEWAAPCPACGGTDRCMIKPDDHDGRGGYWCRQCGTYGDAIQFLRDYEGMGYAEACRHLGMEATRARVGLPRVPKPAAGQDRFEAAPAVSPGELWAKKARDFAAWAHQQLLANPTELGWLAARGLPLEAVQRYRLGWNPGEKGRACLIRPRKSWGLPPVEGKPGKDGKPTQKTTFWIPRGLVIPYLASDDPEGPVLRLRIRRPEADRREFGADKKYYVIPGSAMDAMILGRTSRAFVVVESELDALMLHHQAGDLAGAVSVMTATVKKIEAGVLETLREALAILVALDAEGKDGTGAKGCARWMASFPRAKRWPVPVGKDPGEAFEEGANLRAWIVAGLPPALQPGLLPPGKPSLREGGERKEAHGGAAGESAEAPEAAPATEGDAPTARENAGEACADASETVEHGPVVPWLDPEYTTALDMVPLRELLEGLDRHRVQPVLVDGLAGERERVLALRSAGEIPGETRERLGRLFFGDCLEAVLWFADVRRLRYAPNLKRLIGLPDARGESAAIVRCAGEDSQGLVFAGWTNLDYWRGARPANR